MNQMDEYGRGEIELICGCMFSGKSELLLERLAKARAHAVPVAVFKHNADDRFSTRWIVTHNGRRAEALPLSTASSILELAGEAKLIAIDEAQFFDWDLVDTCQQLADQERDLVIAGLDRDAWGEPFEPVPAIEAIADRVTRLSATCAVCGETAEYTQRTVPVAGRSMIGGAEAYEPRCGKCFKAPPIELRR